VAAEPIVTLPEQSITQALTCRAHAEAIRVYQSQGSHRDGRTAHEPLL